MKLSDLRISTRLAMGFAVVLAMSVLSTTYALVDASRNAQATHRMMESPLAKERAASDWYALIYAAVARTSMIARSTDNTLATVFADTTAASSKRVDEVLKTLEPMLSTDDERAIYSTAIDLRKKYQAAKELVMNTKKDGKDDEAVRQYTLNP
jgi:methyl-accepting chemotaxis protein